MLQNNKVLKLVVDLLFALVNATLILVVICLWLAWQVSDSINSAVSELAPSFVRIEPLRADISHFTEEIAALREDIASIGKQPGGLDMPRIKEIRSKLEEMDERVSETFGKLEALAARPEGVIDHAVNRFSGLLQDALKTVWQCRAESTSDMNS